jgi:hypothetical protein
MAIKTKIVKGAIVVYDDLCANRWLDAFGENVRKFHLDIGTPVDDSTGDPTQFICTPTEAGAGDSVVANSLIEGYALTITTAGNENDGLNMQLRGSAFVLTRGCPLYFGAKIKISDADETDFLVGLCEPDTSLIAAHAVSVTDDGIYFSKMQDTSVISFSNELAGAVGTENSAVPMDTAAHIYEIYWDGEVLNAYVDNNLVTTITAAFADEELTPSIALFNGEAAVKTADIAWMRCIQLR